MKINKRFGDEIYVKWIDAYTDSNWGSVEDALEIDRCSLCYTKGWYIGQKKGFLIIAHTIGNTRKDNIMGKVYIPVKWVKELK